MLSEIAKLVLLFSRRFTRIDKVNLEKKIVFEKSVPSFSLVDIAQLANKFTFQELSV